MTKTQKAIAQLKRGAPVTFTNSVGMVRSLGGMQQLSKAVQKKIKEAGKNRGGQR